MQNLTAFSLFSELQIVHGEVVQHTEYLADLLRLDLHVLRSKQRRAAFEFVGVFLDSLENALPCLHPCLVAVWTMQSTFDLLLVFRRQELDKVQHLQKVIHKLAQRFRREGCNLLVPLRVFARVLCARYLRYLNLLRRSSARVAAPPELANVDVRIGSTDSTALGDGHVVPDRLAVAFVAFNEEVFIVVVGGVGVVEEVEVATTGATILFSGPEGEDLWSLLTPQLV